MIRFIVNTCIIIYFGNLLKILIDVFNNVLFSFRYIYIMANTFFQCDFDHMHYCQNAHTETVYIYEFGGSYLLPSAHGHWARPTNNIKQRKVRIWQSVRP